MKLNPLCERNVLRGYCPESRQISNGDRNGDPFLLFKRLLWNKLEYYRKEIVATRILIIDN